MTIYKELGAQPTTHLCILHYCMRVSQHNYLMSAQPTSMLHISVYPSLHESVPASISNDKRTECTAYQYNYVTQDNIAPATRTVQAVNIVDEEQPSSKTVSCYLCACVTTWVLSYSDLLQACLWPQEFTGIRTVIKRVSIIARRHQRRAITALTTARSNNGRGYNRFTETAAKNVIITAWNCIMND